VAGRRLAGFVVEMPAAGLAAGTVHAATPAVSAAAAAVAARMVMGFAVPLATAISAKGSYTVTLCECALEARSGTTRNGSAPREGRTMVHLPGHGPCGQVWTLV
jgi:hypothetical protein